ncbi:alpha/beta fold hydrolase [Jiangella alkaliphila]|uniref:Alpha/beta hydrolase family protein n=1 Tax=Jiangella alkaliphila TaxID=419479 RepID=A0A1H2LJU7_9ACTN|nr:alpha/beta hydrolase [Jiangella alkaliphila]SDU81290.1 Alpha/beta hydrolase family protein [Jiangella alkaliphila]
MTTTTTSPQNRTIVRAGAKLRAIRVAFRTLDRVAPGIGARWAARLWCTLPNTGGRRRDERPRPGDASTLTLPDGRVVAVESWGFGPPVYLMHGWGGWRGQLGAFVQPLVDAGRRVVAVDAPSHGESGPGRLGRGKATGVEFAEALTAAAGKHGKPAAVVAHSLGAAATAVAVLDGLPAAKLVLVAPSTKLSDGLAAFQRTVGFGERTRTRMLALLERKAGRPLADFDVTGLGRRTELPPTLVVHDRKDKEVPYDDGAELAATWPEAELASTDGLGHQRILRDPDVIRLVVDYVTR